MKLSASVFARTAVRTVALIVAAVLFALPARMHASAVAAESGVCGERLTWTLKDGTLTISGEGEMYDYGAQKDTAPWAKLEVERAVISDGVASVGEYAFYDCDGLRNVLISGSVAVIKSNAFRNCSGLESVVIRGGAVTVSSFAFGYCTGLRSVFIPASVTDISANAFRNDSFFAVYTRAGAYAAGYAAENGLPCVVIDKANGDPDADGETTVSDALIALRAAAKLTFETPELLACCDTDGDGKITVYDALAILRCSAGLADGL